ncbi:MAG TPA: type II secretion system major pseudopilin GspG [Usitatibacter sp.]|nr:type II secretion system major pseudopilin GspG [Usitatibacter sp.]HST01481.1 type II secretion system major pseudopilin GspG [Usitatibacter sp.]
MNRKSSRRERGFTILEIVIVFVLLAGIMAFVGPRIFAKLGQAKSAEQRIRTQSLVGDIEMYKLEVGRYPDNLQALVKQPAGLDRWNGPYAKAEDLKDAWGNDYRYTFPGQSKPFDLLSLGADNKEGGEGEDRDVTN